ncbi:MAG TPA: hypothetical protein VFM93_08245 [Candidatus Limnocylindria bacterium]|nr:hypothetical protein [Candidatus Limnocylindria bacterium]
MRTNDRLLLWTQASAIAFSFTHAVLDWFVGLFGTDRAYLSPTAAALLGLEGILYAAWAVALPLALRGERTWMAVVLTFSFGWAFLANGTSIVFCLPPCPALSPYGDISHLGTLLSGAWASVVAWRQVRRPGGAIARGPVLLAVLLLVGLSVLSAVLAAEFLASQS